MDSSVETQLESVACFDTAVRIIHSNWTQRHQENELIAMDSIERVFDAMIDGIIVVDARGHIVWINSPLRKLLGYDVYQEAVGPPIDDNAVRRVQCDLEHRLLPTAQLPLHRILRGDTLTAEDSVQIHISALYGRELAMLMCGAPLYGAAGNILGAVVEMHDVTKCHRLEQQRSDLLQVVAHNLLTPITGVRLYLQAQQRRLRNGQPPFLPGEGHFDSLDTNLKLMESLVDDLRNLVSIDAGTLELELGPCDIGALCRKEIEELRVLVPGRTIESVLPTEPIVTELDAQRIGKVIANYLSNALKYSPIDRPVRLILRAVETVIHVAVEDEGPGIPAEELEHIWERFYCAEHIHAHEGLLSLGLGLYMSRAIVERHGGQVGVESTVGAGSTFWFALPLISRLYVLR